ncbi:MAG TPA: LURP-one-related family protein [Thermomicrobiaceae bacterium]|nr:LURP-one-related family protein [Thermomicrobiaceae bacterium]
MPLLHRHHQPGATRYRMREKLFAIGDDFWIETEDGDRVFKVDGKALRVRDTFVLKDSRGEDLLKAQAKELRIRDTMKIERDGEAVATVKKALVTPLRDRFSIQLADGTELKAKGNILDHEYKIERDGDTVAEISKRWFRARETYGIAIAPGQNDALLLAVSACIDEMEGH